MQILSIIVRKLESQPSAFSGISMVAIIAVAFSKFGTLPVIPVTQFSAEVG